MEKQLHRISAILFYILGSSFFLMYLLYKNKMLGLWPTWWMEIFDLPLALVAILYGGTSLHLSIRKPEKVGVVSAVIIAIPLVALFGLLFVMNFWEVLF